LADSISIVMKMTDDVSGTMKSIASSSTGVSKQFEELQRKAQQLGSRYEDLNKKAASASAEAMGIKRAMDEAARTFKKTGDEADKVKFEKLKQEYTELTDASKGYSAAAKDTIRDINDVSNTMRKMQDGTPSGGSSGGGSSGTLAALAKAGLGKMLTDSASQAVGILGESLLGSSDAAFVSSILSGIGTGAAIGSVIPGIGTAIGAAIGAASGLIQGSAQKFSEKDDYFKEYYNQLYSDVSEATDTKISSGSDLSANREAVKLSFETLLGGADLAEEFLDEIGVAAATTPFAYDELVDISKILLTFGYAVEDIIPTMKKVGDAGAALGLSTSDIGTVATYIGRMKSTDKASLEYLNPLNERGFSVFQWIADDLGISQKDVYNKISKGELSGGYVSDLILEQFTERFPGMMDALSQTTSGLESTLEDIWDNIDIAGGEAYNAIRNTGRTEDIASYEGPLGDALTELSKVSGESRAHLDNLSDQYRREALSAVLLGEDTSLYDDDDQDKLTELHDEYQAAKKEYENGSFEAGLRMESAKEAAEALAAAAYESSSEYQAAFDIEMDQVAAIRENTVGLEAATNAYKAANESSKGVAAATTDNTIAYLASNTGLTKEEYTALGFTEYYYDAMIEDHYLRGGSVGGISKSNAYGLRRVPYDGYPALLHEGEQVLTSEEARRRDSGNGIVVSITGNNFTVRDDSDIDLIASALAEKIQMASVAYGG